MMPVYNPSPAWLTFFATEAGASAALTGLIFVAVSINLTMIVSAPQIVARAAKAIQTLAGVLLASSLSMAAGQPLVALGLELAVLGVGMWAATTRAYWAASHNNPYVGAGQKVFHLALTQLSALPFVVAGVFILVGGGEALPAQLWLLAGTVFSLVSALVDAWVLLVEIHR
jgi:hypothetical protein